MSTRGVQCFELGVYSRVDLTLISMGPGTQPFSYHSFLSFIQLALNSMMLVCAAVSGSVINDVLDDAYLLLIDISHCIYGPPIVLHPFV